MASVKYTAGDLMRGFMHVIEIVIISLLVIVVISQFFRNAPSQSAWERAQLKALSEDILHSMKATGVKWTETSSVEGQLARLLGTTNIIYEMEIQNLAPPSLWVGCLCTGSEFSAYSAMLADHPFMLNGMEYKISLERVDQEHPDFPLVYDVIVIGSEPDVLEGYQNLMQKYLSTGRGIIELRHMDRTLLNMDDAQLNVFGIEPDSDQTQNPGTPTHKIAFNVTPESRYYNILKYFLAIPNDTDMSGNPSELDDFINSSFVFSNFLKGGDEEEKVAPTHDNGVRDMERVVMHVRDTSPEAPAAIVRDKAYLGTGRTVWLPPSDLVSAGDREEYAALLKSLVLWASGERMLVTGHEVRNPESSYLIDVIERARFLNPSMSEQLLQKTTFFHPLKLVLSLGYALK